jgi:2-methylcitrate dehydratase
MAGRLLGLDNKRLAHALALSLARAATPAVVRSGHISAAKSIANALVAQSGVQSVELARHGVTGPLAILEHKRGLPSVFPKADALAALDAPLGAKPYVTNAHVKAYPCLATGQSIVAAGLALRGALGGDVAAARRVRVILGENPTVRDQAFDPGRIDPRSREAADHSFNFLAAVSLLDGEFGLAQFDNERWHSPDVRAVMAKLDMSLDQDLSDRARGPYPCAMEAVLVDGSTKRVEMLAPPGYSSEGLDENVVVGKFNALTRGCLEADERNGLAEAALALDAARSCAALVAALKPRKNAR